MLTFLQLRSLRSSILLGALLTIDACLLVVDTTGLDGQSTVGVDDGGKRDGDAQAVAALDSGSDAVTTTDAFNIPNSATRWTQGAGANNHAYEVVVSPQITWLTAQQAAIARGGHLATITSAEENAFVAALVLANPAVVGKNGWGPWLGGVHRGFSDAATSGWAWITSEPWGFTSWEPTEPNADPNENVLGFYKTPNWGDYANSIGYGNGYVLELE